VETFDEDFKLHKELGEEEEEIDPVQIREELSGKIKKIKTSYVEPQGKQKINLASGVDKE